MELNGRSFEFHVPAGLPLAPPPPLVLAFHGGGADGKAMRLLSNLDARADREGWVVAYPDGLDGNWNDGRDAPAIRAQRDRVDDVGLAAALVDHLVAAAGIDRARVFATGFSNGGMLCHRLAVERPDLVAAIAPVSGPMPAPLARRRASLPVPVLMVHGTADPIVPYDGGAVMGDADRGRVASLEETAAYWRQANRCQPEAILEDLVPPGPSDRTEVRQATWRPADDEGAEVVAVTVEGGGHTWPGGRQYQPERVIGVMARAVQASDLIAAFFSRCKGRC